ncbi:DUF6243 family protein [Streptomyces sp. NPDC002490]|uniref:DUF6243 family protein n=1 Tax=Streptomyces sp. NPDC002490 TaxID=3154416 RepID=UPI00332CB49C
MARGGDLLGVGGTRSKLSRGALRGRGPGGAPGANTDPGAAKRDLLRRLREERAAKDRAPRAGEEHPDPAPTSAPDDPR